MTSISGLTPRTKGFSHVIENIDASKVPYIYDVTLAVHPKDGGPATIPNILVGRKTVAEVYIRRIDISQVPKDPKGSAQFLITTIFPPSEALKRFTYRTDWCLVIVADVLTPKVSLTHCLKITLNMSHLNVSILVFSTNFCPI